MGEFMIKKQIYFFIILIASIIIFTACPGNFKSNDGIVNPPSPLPKYTVTFDVQGRGQKPDNIPNLASGTKLTAEQTPVLEFSGYKFEGWYKDTSFSAKWINAVDEVTADTRLYAKWDESGTPAGFTLWQSRTNPHPNDYYRIPALATLKDGTLLAVTDIRYTAPSDLGHGHALNLLIKRSTDNGENWSEEKLITNAPNSGSNGYGDAAIVADRESDKVLILCVYGDIKYQQGSSSHHQSVKQFVSDDGGQNFTEKDITDTIYGFNNSWVSLFFGSGRIMQSRYIKVGSHYRIYSALLSKSYGNAVLYSDDFGDTWKVLGNADTSPVSDGDEAKVEELPDGNVVISSRRSGWDTDPGRLFNIFTYSGTEAGAWASPAKICELGKGRGTNGEIFVIKAQKKDTHEPAYLVLQSMPAGIDTDKERTKVSIYWRELQNQNQIDLADFSDKNQWNQYLVEEGFSAYSTMTPLRDGGIGFLYEQKSGNKTNRDDQYDIVFKNLPIHKITGGEYEAVFLGTGAKDSPYTSLTGEKVPQTTKDYFANEELHWKGY